MKIFRETKQVESVKKATILLTLSCLGLFLLIMYVSQNEENSNRENYSTLKILYDEHYLGYNSTSWGMITAPVGVSDANKIQKIKDIPDSIYSYDSVNLFSPDYVKVTVEKFFPEINLSRMNISTKIMTKYNSTYIEISNDSIDINLLASGAVEYRLKRDFLRECDNIQTNESAIDLALAFLNIHGGIPLDIGEIEVMPTYSFTQNEIIYGSYIVTIHRNITKYRIIDSLLCNQIQFVFDSTDKNIYVFEYHWPQIDIAFKISNIPSISDIIDYYDMNSLDNSRTNITRMEIAYYVPPTIQEAAFDANKEIYFIAPYLIVYTEDGCYYILGLFTSEKFD